ncbi:MAG: hypothetical protein QXU54_01145 [Candidatus Micrarchaeia archaeon]
MAVVERKVSGGKLVRISAEFNGDTLASLRITGDFFIHPEEHLLTIESSLVGTHISSLRERIEKACAQRGAQCIGFSAQDIYEMLVEAYNMSKR